MNDLDEHRCLGPAVAARQYTTSARPGPLPGRSRNAQNMAPHSRLDLRCPIPGDRRICHCANARVDRGVWRQRGSHDVGRSGLDGRLSCDADLRRSRLVGLFLGLLKLLEKLKLQPLTRGPVVWHPLCFRQIISHCQSLTKLLAALITPEKASPTDAGWHAVGAMPPGIDRSILRERIAGRECSRSADQLGCEGPGRSAGFPASLTSGTLNSEVH